MTESDPTRSSSPELKLILEMLRRAESPDAKASALLRLGAFHESQEDWNTAVDSYTKALAAGSNTPIVNYYGNNNLGYSLIQLGQLDEAEGYCAAAIKVDADRHNAHKNLSNVSAYGTE